MGRQARIQVTPALRRCKYLFDLVKRTTDEYVLVIDIERNVALLSPNLVQDFGLPAEIVEDFPGLWTPLVHPEERAQFRTSINAVMDKLNIFEHAMEYRVRDRKGNYVWIRSRGRVGAINSDGSQRNYVWIRSRGRVGAINSDGSQPIFVSMIQRMGQRNQADDVTGLLNKYQFEHNIKVALSAYRITGVGGAVMVVGIDNFKIVNETFNRMMGDVVLRSVAQAIAELLPEELTLFKLDGDEFGIIYPEADTTTMTTLYSGIQKSLTRPIDLEGHPYFCTVSAGTAFYPQAGKDYLVLHKHAEAAMDLAKRDGKNRNCIFSRDQYNRWVRSISMRDSLRESVERGCTDFSLFYQPQVDAHTRELIGAEALLRWRPRVSASNGASACPVSA